MQKSCKNNWISLGSTHHVRGQGWVWEVTTSRKQTDSAYEHMSKFENAADMNLEYLKNIMLKYLSARNQAERKALIPAISAVLCLTQEETKQAFESVNASTGIGNTLFDSISRFRG